MFRWLKRFSPKSLYGRAALILLLPVVLIQLIVGIVFIQRFFEDVTRQMTENQSVEIRLVLDALEDSLDAAETAGEPLGISVEPMGDALADYRAWYDITGRTVESVLREQFPQTGAIDLGERQRTVTMAVADGTVQLSFPRRRVSASNPHQLLVIMVFAGVVLAIISAMFLRNQLRPITRMAKAAEAFGRGSIIPYTPSGATEMRAAGHAFVDMRNRIDRFNTARTLMLSGVSHDLRTPLTRMRLGLEMSDDPEAVEMLGDVEEMERMISEFLDYARTGDEGAAETLDAAALMEDCVGKARRAGAEVRFVPPRKPASVTARREPLARAVDNLLGNAQRYATHARASVRVGGKAVVLAVEDDGPGIPESQRDEAIRPFSRLDAARSQNKGKSGVGLGLSIAADIARRHGGQLRLGRSEMGGLSAEIVLPR